jgi:hypothetical protein
LEVLIQYLQYDNLFVDILMQCLFFDGIICIGDGGQYEIAEKKNIDINKTI